MKQVEKILQLAYNFEKQASTFDVQSVKKVVKAALEQIWTAHPNVMDGFLYLSNVKINDNLVSFDINFDKSKSNNVQNNKNQRDSLINTHVKNMLATAFKTNFELGFQELFI